MLAGLFPDVAFAYLSANCMSLPMALYLGLTGTRLTTAADLLATGLGTHYVPSAQLESLRQALLAASFTPDSARETMKGMRQHPRHVCPQRCISATGTMWSTAECRCLASLMSLMISSLDQLCDGFTQSTAGLYTFSHKPHI
jgi:enoyl-CoA hydratase/carnithine racemase